MPYLMCASCESSVDVDHVPTKVTCEGKVVAGVCEECMANIQIFRISLIKDSPKDLFKALQFQCLSVFKNATKPDEPE